MDRERKVEAIVEKNLAQWQKDGLVPDMEIEPGHKTNEPIRTRGWTYWHHLFNARQLVSHALVKKHTDAVICLNLANCLNWNSKLSRWDSYRSGEVKDVFYSQAINPLLNYGCRSWFYQSYMLRPASFHSEIRDVHISVSCEQAYELSHKSEIWITDPPYADAVHYHEITEFFIAWLRKNPPPPFDQWTWDSRRALAIKGSGDDFRRSMIDAYSAMTEHMPENGMQCVMFTHQDTNVWSDMVGIFWGRIAGGWSLVYRHGNHFSIKEGWLCARHCHPDIAQAGCG
jgi:adenine-specific DNA methylase